MRLASFCSAQLEPVGPPQTIISNLCDLLLGVGGSRVSLLLDPVRASVVLTFLNKTVLANHLGMFSHSNSDNELITTILNTCERGLYLQAPPSSSTNSGASLTPIQK